MKTSDAIRVAEAVRRGEQLPQIQYDGIAHRSDRGNGRMRRFWYFAGLGFAAVSIVFASLVPADSIERTNDLLLCVVGLVVSILSQRLPPPRIP